MNYFTELPQDIQIHIYKLCYDKVLDHLTQTVQHELLCFGHLEQVTKLSIRHLDLEATYTHWIR